MCAVSAALSDPPPPFLSELMSMRLRGPKAASSSSVTHVVHQALGLVGNSQPGQFSQSELVGNRLVHSAQNEGLPGRRQERHRLCRRKQAAKGSNIHVQPQMIDG